MPTPRHRTSTFRKVFVKTPGGRTIVQYKRKKSARAQCAQCQRYLAGVACGIPSRVKKLPKSSRRPERAFGGVYCSRCSRTKIVELARK
ncbi:MAG: 50S ribosomal protein L34e [Candidatus Nanoarchaeia archaeon]|nr:50S ribosomal protein L34e [Candidatus Nanoarchaeia archaeon]